MITRRLAARGTRGGLPRADRVLAAGGAALLAAQAAGEIVARRATYRLVGPVRGGSLAVLVLGYGDAGMRRANRVNRWRVRAGLRSLDPDAARSVLVLAGGPVRSSVPEAVLMARYAREECGHEGPLVTEQCSRSTWQNIERSAELLESFDRIRIVSHPLHAQLARAYLLTLRPDLAARLERGEEYRFGEGLSTRLAEMWLGLPALRRARQQGLRVG